MPPFFSSVALLCENSDSVFIDTSQVLLRLANTILTHPNEPKYRRVRLANATIQNKLLTVNGGMEALFDMGFVEDDDHLTLPQNASLSIISDLCVALKIHLERITRKNCNNGGAKPKTVAAPSVQNQNSQQADSSSSVPASGNFVKPTEIAQKSVMAFLQKLESSFEHVLLYEDTLLQQKALSLMPLQSMKEKAHIKLEKLTEEADVSEAELLIMEMLQWFKFDFFTWTDSPKCAACQSSTHAAGMATPTEAELMWGASRVENYQCTQCSSFTRFPRYNHPGKLLETRTGRCGEWANCFTLCCRAAGFESRYILDFTDHVWTEIYSDKQQCWLHCDPCEALCDRPLIYEAGWGKKLSYVIAFSKDEVQDVSWRYSANHVELLKRRNSIQENVLIRWLVRARERRQKNLTSSRKEVLLKRTADELISFMAQKSASKDETSQGRTSGSLAWRLSRGETDSAKTSKSSYVFYPTSREITSACMEIWYSCASDRYVRVSDGGQQVNDWAACVHMHNNIQRKEEHDWKMAYLARTVGTQQATIEWKWDLSDTKLVIHDVELFLSSKCFESGAIRWRACAGDQCEILNNNNSRFVVRSFKGCKTLTLTADLSGGNGDCAWQHTQLFRQSIQDHSYPFQVKVHMQTDE